MLLVTAASLARAPARAAEVVVDASERVGQIRPLHGVNKGPLDAGGTVDLSAHHRAAGFPLVRLHDCHWPNPDVVDVHVVFPDSGADPSRPASYDFARTDAYVKSVIDTGAGIVFRLGESIEHTPDKRHVNPPADPAKWAQICLGIIRHYNEGWAGGSRHGIRYWEIWNEPDNRPACWTGDDAEFLRLYGTAARAIKAVFPELEVGGPGMGNVGKPAGDDALDAPPFVVGFLAYCKREGVPLDFFSWHAYAGDPRAVAAQARGVRGLLDRHGLENTESHLNEWNLLPDDDWGPATPAGQGAPRQQFYERIGGAEGAAFAAAALVLMHDARVDVANYFAADTQGFGLFTPDGVPKRSYGAFRAFRTLLDAPARVKVTGADESTGLAACAGVAADGSRVAVLVSNYASADGRVGVTVKGLPWSGPAACEVQVIDAEHDLQAVRSETVTPGADGSVRVEQQLEKPGVCLIVLRPEAAAAGRTRPGRPGSRGCGTASP